MFENLLSSGQVSKACVLPTNLGPGPTELLHGDTCLGFFGEVLAADFFTSTQAVAGLGLSGQVTNNTTPWLKFVLDGTILYYPKLPIRNYVTWQATYQAGAVYGDDTYGLYPEGSPRLQNARISKGEDTFRIRLPKGMNRPDFITSTDPANVDHMTGSEWNRLMYSISKTPTSNDSIPKWNLYSDSELGINNTSLSFYACQERVYWTLSPNSNKLTRIMRGNGTVAGYSYSFTNDGNRHWRPILELIQ